MELEQWPVGAGAARPHGLGRLARARLQEHTRERLVGQRDSTVELGGRRLEANVARSHRLGVLAQDDRQQQVRQRLNRSHHSLLVIVLNNINNNNNKKQQRHNPEIKFIFF